VTAAMSPLHDDQGRVSRAPSSRPDHAVVFEEAAARLGGRTVWRDVSFTLERGEFVAVLGPNGAGKSTLMKSILGLLPLAAGRATVLGKPAGEARARVGYLPQRRNFDASTHIRGVDIVQLGLDGNRWGIPLPGTAHRRRAARRIAEVLDLVDATHYADRPIGQLSGGEQQRLLIAQALVRRPDLLLLDEPLDSLDLPNQAGVAALVRRICREEQVAVMLVARSSATSIASSISPAAEPSKDGRRT
jgi:zinc/manganese transport system ATP-binding protein